MGRSPGWFVDPFARHELRYFDGTTWADSVVDRGVASSDRLVDFLEIDRGERRATSFPTRGSPRALLGLTITGLVVAFALGFGFVAIDVALGRPGGPLVELLASEAGIWSAFITTCVLATRRFGRNSIRSDFDLSFSWRDPGIGLLGAIIGHCLGAIALLALPSSARHLTNPDQPIFQPIVNHSLGWIVLTLVTCVGAPFFEELFFRGLLQGQLIARYGVGVGLGVTTIVFGAAHFFNAPGVTGLVYALIIACGGIALGAVRYLTGRLGASMATHCLFNGLALAALAATMSH